MYELENLDEMQEKLEGENLEQSEENQEVQETEEVKEVTEEQENQEETEEGKESLGYSSDYYKHEMARAIKNGNKIAYENAKKNYSHAKTRETLGAGETSEQGKESLGYSSKYNEMLKQNTKDYTKAALEANEEKEENEGKKEALGYSSDYYEHRMEVAIKNGNKIALENAQRNYAKAKVREST